MSVWQRLNAPRNKRERRVAKIARDQERERILAEIDKLKPYIDENGVANWFKHAAYVRKVKGDD